MNLYILKDGNRMGPFPLEDALRLRNNGKISDTDWAWHEGLPEWVPLTDFRLCSERNAPAAG